MQYHSRGERDAPSCVIRSGIQDRSGETLRVTGAIPSLRSDSAQIVSFDSESRVLVPQPQPVSANHLVVGAARLQVLADHVNILEGTLEGMPLVD